MRREEMKKLFLFIAFMVVLSATAYGQEAKLDFRASGFIQAASEFWRWNCDTTLNKTQGIINVLNPTSQPPDGKGNGGEWNKTASYAEMRGRLKFDAVMGKELSGTIFLEMDSTTWGDQVSALAPSGNGQQSNKIGYWQADRAGIEIKNLYFDVAIPYVPIPMTARFGVQPIGIRSSQSAGSLG